MIPESFNLRCAEKLSTFSVAPITEPYSITTHWMHVFTPSVKLNYISNKLHRHTFFEMHIVLSGEAVYKLGGSDTESVSENHALLISPGTKHIVKGHSEDIFKFSLTFSADQESRFYQELTKHDYCIFSFDNKLADSLDAIFAAMDKNSVFTDSIIRGRLLEIYSLLPGASAIPADTRKSQSTDIRFENALRYIADNISSALTCTEIASHCGISTKQLSRIFEKYAGKPPLEYIHGEKTRVAQKLLTETDWAIKKISEQLGFANEYYFNTFFVRQCGMPPGYFRKNKPETY